MKLFHLLTLTSIILSSFIANAICAPNEIANKRDFLLSSLIANEFDDIDQTIQKLDQAQKSHPQSGQPDFSKATVLLLELAKDAEIAKTELILKLFTSLDQKSSNRIDTSLKSSADHVQAITEMVKTGKQWFSEKGVTEIIIQILQGNILIFRDLFYTLNQHTSSEFLQSFQSSESKFICQIVSAIQILDPNQVSQSDSQKCASGNYFGSGSSNGGDSIKPAGWDSCGCSPSTYFSWSYQKGTIGTSSTVCDGSYKITSENWMIPTIPFPHL